MANLDSNTLYNAPTVPTGISNLSGLVKALQERTQQTSSNTVQTALNNHFNPTVAASIFSPAQSAVTSLNPATSVAPTDWTPPVDTPFAPSTSGTPTEPLPEGYNQFTPTDASGHWVAPTNQAEIRNWPADLGGGQFIIDPSQPGKMIKSDRYLIPDDPSKPDTGIKKAILGNLSGSLYQVDHNVPLWAGGADTLANMQVLDIPTHERKTAAQAVPLTLLANGKIDLQTARTMALGWQNHDVTGLSAPDNSGYVPLADAEKYAQKWENDVKNPNTWKYFGEEFKKNMQDFGKGWLPTPIREFAKGLVGGGTAGIVPDTGASPDEGAVGSVSNFVGNLAGSLTGIGIAGKILGKIGLLGSAAKAASVPWTTYEGIGMGIGTAKTVAAVKDVASMSGDVLKSLGLETGAETVATDAGNLTKAGVRSSLWAPKWAPIKTNAITLAAWGELGLTGRELTGQEKFTIGNNVKQIATDVAYGGLLGASGQTVKGYTNVVLWSTILPMIEGQSTQAALENGILMGALHGLGYQKGKNITSLSIANDEAYKMSSYTLNNYLPDLFDAHPKGSAIPQVLTYDPAQITKIDKARVDYQKKYPLDPVLQGIGPITNTTDAIKFGESAARIEAGNLMTSKGALPSEEEITKELQRITLSSNRLTNRSLPLVEQDQSNLKDLYSIGEKLRPQVSPNNLKPVMNAVDTLQKLPSVVNINSITPETQEKYKNADFSEGGSTLRGIGRDKKGVVLDAEARNNLNAFARGQKESDGHIYFPLNDQSGKIGTFINYASKIQGKPLPIENPENTLRGFMKDSKTGEYLPVGYFPEPNSLDPRNPFNVNKTFTEIVQRLKQELTVAKDGTDLQTRLQKDKAYIINKVSTPVDIKVANNLFARKKELLGMSDIEFMNELDPPNAQTKHTLDNTKITPKMKNMGLNTLIVDVRKLSPIGKGFGNLNDPYVDFDVTNNDWMRSFATQDAPVTTPVEQGIRNIISKIKAQKTSETAGNILDKVTPPEPTNIPPKTKGLTKDEIRSLKKQGFSDDMIQKINSQKIVEKPVVQTFPPQEQVKSPETPSKTAVLPPIVPQEAPKTPSAIKSPEPVKTAPKQAITTSAKPDLTEEFFNDMVERIDDLKPDLSSPENHEKSLMSVINGFKRKNPGLPENEFRNIMNDAKSRAKAYVQDYIDNTYQGTKRFGTDDNYSRAQASENKNVLIKRYNELKARGKEVTLKPFEKTEMADLETKIKQHVELDKKANDIQTKAADLNRPLTADENAKLQDLNKQRFTLTQDYQGGKNSSLVLANKFGLELQPPNDAGIRYLKLDRGGNPTFTEEFKKSNGIKNQSPMDFWGSFLGNEMKVYKSNLSKGSKEWGTGIEEMKNSSNPYAKGFAGAIDEALKEKYDIKDPQTGETKYSWKDSWKANSALKNMKNWFDLSNEEGYANSQPFRRTAAITAGKNYEEVRKNVTKADTETKKASEEAAENRLNLLSKGNAPVLPQGMSVKDPNQFENVSEDLTPFDMMTNGLLNTEVRNQLVDRYNNLRKDMGSGLAKSNPKVGDEMKALFAQIKKLSVNIPNEVKTWKIGSKIVLKNGGEPTVEEGIKDGLRVAASIFKNKKTPGYIKYENVRNNVLKQLGNKNGEQDEESNLKNIKNKVKTNNLESGKSNPTSNKAKRIEELKNQIRKEYDNDYKISPESEGQTVKDYNDIRDEWLFKAVAPDSPILSDAQKEYFDLTKDVWGPEREKMLDMIKNGDWEAKINRMNNFVKNNITKNGETLFPGQKINVKEIINNKELDDLNSPEPIIPHRTYMTEKNKIINEIILKKDKTTYLKNKSSFSKAEQKYIEAKINPKETDGKGGPYDGQGGIISGAISNVMTGINNIFPPRVIHYSDIQSAPAASTTSSVASTTPTSTNFKVPNKMINQSPIPPTPSAQVVSMNPISPSVTTGPIIQKPLNIDNYLNAIAFNETRGVEGDPYNSYQPSSKSNLLGDALGKWRVTEATLKQHAQRYLGRPVTRQEFLASPQLQKTFMVNRALYQNSLGYTPEQMADMHRSGGQNESDPGSTTYQNPDYVKSFGTIYNATSSPIVQNVSVR